MGWLSRAAWGAARGSARGAGSLLARHVVPDTLIPSWQTQRTFSKAGSSISRGISRLARKRKQSKARNQSKPKQPGFLARAWQTEMRPGLQAVAAYQYRAAPSITKGWKLPAWTARTPAAEPASYMNPKRAALQAGPKSVRARSTKKPASRPAPRLARPEPIVRASVPNEKKFGYAEKNSWDQGRGFNTPSEWDEPRELGPFPRRGPSVSKRELEKKSRSRLARARTTTGTSRRTSVRRNLWTEDSFIVQRAKNRERDQPKVAPRKKMWYDFD